MFILNSHITIGQFAGIKVNAVKINKSITSLLNKAVIKVPATTRLKLNDVVTESVDVAKNFKEGDSVQLMLGYNNVLENEFEGFVNKINFTTPLEIECEGYTYPLKKITYKKTFKNTKLITILQELCSNTPIVISKNNIVDVEITKLVLQNHNGVEALQMIKKILDDTVNFWFDGKELHAQLFPIQAGEKKVKYRIGYNVINADQLKKIEAKNADVEVVYAAHAQDGTRKTVTGGQLKKYKTTATSSSQTFGEKKQINTSQTHLPSLQKMANSKHYKLSYGGYEGKLTCFLQPYCGIGYKAELQDKNYKEREGAYLVLSTEVNYSRNGGRRIIEIGHKLN